MRLPCSKCGLFWRWGSGEWCKYCIAETCCAQNENCGHSDTVRNAVRPG